MDTVLYVCMYLCMHYVNMILEQQMYVCMYVYDVYFIQYVCMYDMYVLYEMYV